VHLLLSEQYIDFNRCFPWYLYQHINTVVAHKVSFLTVKPVGKYTNHWA